ncbi:hypothetical protein BsWGS_15305 [Bradybaena similaris]
MDKVSFQEVGMEEGGRVHMPSQSGPGPSNSPAVYAFTKCVGKNRIVQFPQSPEGGWEIKERDTSGYDMDVCIDRGKLESDNLRLKKKIPEPQEADAYMDCDNALDIHKKLATKKVVLPEETKDEPAAALDLSLNVQHKKRSQKRTLTQASEPNDSYTLNPETLKVTDDVIERIKKDSNLEVCLNYNRQQFSNFRNLTVVPDSKVASGTFGDVIKVRDSQTGNVLMQKQVKKNSQGKFEIEKNEIEVPLQFANLENIARFVGLYCNGTKLLYFMEDAGVSLRHLVSDPEMCLKLSEPGRIEKIMLDLYTVISHLAKHLIVHCDIKPENVCLNTETWVAKLIDFGSCRTPQDKIDYKGTTPEYLDSVANKFYYELAVKQNKQYPVHKLDELDDVFAAGLVGLYLYMKKHPLIYFFTRKDSVPDLQTRHALMKKNSELTEEQMSQLLAVPMSDIMRVLLQGVLALDRNKRWRAREAVSFLQEKLGSDVQPPNKLCRHEPQPCSSTQAEDLSMFVNLRQKYSDSAVVQTTQTCESPSSPNIVQRQGLGITMKTPVASAQTGSILLPAKLSLQPHMMPPRQHLSAQLLYAGQMRPAAAPQGMLKLNDQETQDYQDLVMSFGEKTKMCQSRSPVYQTQNFTSMQQRDWQTNRVLPEPAGSSQRMMFQNLRAANCGPVQDGQLAARPVLGLSGVGLYPVAGGFNSNPSVEINGNLPIFEQLMPSGEETYRPKLKGRRGHGSQDEK